MKIRNLAIATAVCFLSVGWVSAAGVAITSVVMSGNFVTSITATSVVYANPFLVSGTSTGGSVDGTPPPDLSNISFIDNSNLLDGFAMAPTPAGNSWTTSNFGGLGDYSDSNGTGYDFFLFERGGQNDRIDARALYSVDGGLNFLLGRSSLIANSVGPSAQWGGTGFSSTFSDTQPIFGTAFSITDFLDANTTGGSFLPNTAIIRNITFIAPRVDPVSLLAVVPEPSTIGLSGLAVLFLLARRSRKAN